MFFRGIETTNQYFIASNNVFSPVGLFYRGKPSPKEDETNEAEAPRPEAPEAPEAPEGPEAGGLLLAVENPVFPWRLMDYQWIISGMWGCKGISFIVGIILRCQT